MSYDPKILMWELSSRKKVVTFSRQIVSFEVLKVWSGPNSGISGVGGLGAWQLEKH